MGTSPREAEAAADHLMLKLAREKPLQSLSADELRLDITPVTVYPEPIKAKVWVRFGEIPARLDCRIHRTTSSAAAIEFTIRDKIFRCWVWGNAVTVDQANASGAASRPPL